MSWISGKFPCAELKLFQTDVDKGWNNFLNKITFKRTRSLSNAVCFKHDNNVCVCAVSALILLPVVKLSLEMDSVTSISYIRGQFHRSTPLFVYFGDFSLRMLTFDHCTISSSNITTYLTSAHPFLPERDYVTFGSLLSQFRLSSVCLSVCNVGAPYSGGWSFRQYFFTAVYAGHPPTSVQNFAEIVPGKPLHRGR